MQHFSNSSLPPSSTNSLPAYQPLSDASLALTIELLLRKGKFLQPALARNEAVAMAQMMYLEHFLPDAIISFDAKSPQHGRLMLILAGEANTRQRDASPSRSHYSPVDQHERWSTATEGATLGLVQAFAGFFSRFTAQAVTELFVASMSREAIEIMKHQNPPLALRLMEMIVMEMAMLVLDHERNLQAMNNVARSMQNHIDGEAGATRPAGLA